MCPTIVSGGFGVVVTLLWEGKVSKEMAPIPTPTSMMQAINTIYRRLPRVFFGGACGKDGDTGNAGDCTGTDVGVRFTGVMTGVPALLFEVGVNDKGGEATR